MKIISKCALLKLVGCLVASPIIVYAILLIARVVGADYDVTHGETFIIWILMAILVAQCWRCSGCNDKKK